MSNWRWSQLIGNDIEYVTSSTCPINKISIKYEIQLNFVMPVFIAYSAVHNKIVHMSQQ